MATRDPIDLLQVDIDLSPGLTIGGRDVPYTDPGLELRVGLDGVPTLLVPTLALGGRAHGLAEVTYLDSTDTEASPKARGRSVSAALRSLADQIEGAP